MTFNKQIILFLFFCVFYSKVSCVCNQTQSKEVELFINKHLLPFLEVYKYEINEDCPFHPSRYIIEENNKETDKPKKMLKKEKLTSFPDTPFFTTKKFCLSNLCELFFCCSNLEKNPSCNVQLMETKQRLCNEIMYSCFSKMDTHSPIIYETMKRLFCVQLDCYKSQKNGDEIGRELLKIKQDFLKGPRRTKLIVYGSVSGVLILIAGYLIKSKSEGTLSYDLKQYGFRIIIIVVLSLLALFYSNQ
ncbi:hypothetical protein M0813_30112 [Anaeramoeba flamelloides]|uniref:Uncharacterized protein n=1 Tax=Anaeramoeba flamelloides TaxID=1746091 RepID=A0AAV8A3H8_9EUKA|nr:hypothetical protein M0812_00812 [Anaeramoeba flamelloides]KAJ6233233.1 hypothetical protein M0813_30112 [Anaeramoeba flamelloides]